MNEQDFTQFDDIELMDAETDAIVGGKANAADAHTKFFDAHTRFSSSPGPKSQKKDPVGTLDNTIPPTV